ncbi:lipoyl protein ligase domain-containing protein [Methylibium sp.]|uniref:lipoyl protein ligase domain-containing protein n=1 Tax=Methylibium sp. TaxID=2067992 RepID=UPI003D11448A
MAEPSVRRQFTLLDGAPADSDGVAIEQTLLRRAADGVAVAHVWEATPGFMVPASYRRFERFEAACESFTDQGLPVQVRCSGGGLVPQGPGMVNLSLAWRTHASMGAAAEAVYVALCRLLQASTATFGIVAAPQAVSGSFCDGRYNLAVNGRKVAGTAQYWRRASASEQIVLAHACLLVDADLETLTRHANAFEAEIGSGRVYLVDAITNLARGSGGPVPAGGTRRRVTPPHVKRLLQQIATSSAVPC